MLLLGYRVGHLYRMDISSVFQDYYADLARVEGVAIDPADLIGAFPGVRGFEYSFDGVEFKDKSVIVS